MNAMTTRPPTRLLDHLPAIYRQPDAGDDLRRLLQVLEEFFFTGHHDAPHDARHRVMGIEQGLQALPALFAPLGLDEGSHDAQHRTPQRFVPWLATWLAFAPQQHFEPERLRHIVAGIVPLYGRRGTRGYMEELLRLCFDEIDDVRIDEQDRAGLHLGRSTLGVDSLLAEDRPFWFSVDVHLDPAAPGGPRLEQRLRAVVDFAKPAHTAYDLRVHQGHRAAAPSG
jgi:phage tail-like protein